MITVFKTKQNNGYIWINVTDPSEDELLGLAKEYNLPTAAVQDCLQPEHLPKYEQIGEVKFIITRIYDNNSSKKADTLQELSDKIAMFLTQDYLITIHRHDYPFLAQLKDKPPVSEKCLDNTYQLLYRILENIITSYEAPAVKLINEIDYFESNIFLKKRIPSLLENLYYIKRKAAVTKMILSLSKDIIERTDNHHTNQACVQELKDTFLHVETLLIQVNENINSLLNIYLSISSQKTNEVVRILTLFSVFFMPLTFIVGIYGMNFDYMPELHMKSGYPGILIIMGGITIGIYLWFKKKGWL